jgi:hypothetical protein
MVIVLPKTTVEALLPVEVLGPVVLVGVVVPGVVVVGVALLPPMHPLRAVEATRMASMPRTNNTLLLIIPNLQ